jgi:hypothetical protein
MLKYILPLALVLGLGTSCYSDEGVGYSYGSPYYGDDYGYLSPGVDAVYGYDYPLFFADGFYWRWYGGNWYSSHWRDHGWAFASRVPGHVRGIAHPWAYGGRGFATRPGFRGGYGGYRGGFHGNLQARGGFRGGGVRGGGFHGGAHGGGHGGGHHR